MSMQDVGVGSGFGVEVIKAPIPMPTVDDFIITIAIFAVIISVIYYAYTEFKRR